MQAWALFWVLDPKTLHLYSTALREALTDRKMELRVCRNGDPRPCGRSLGRGINGWYGHGIHKGGLAGKKGDLERTCTHRALAPCPVRHLVLETWLCPLPFLRALWLLWAPWPSACHPQWLWQCGLALKRFNGDLGRLGPVTRMS